MGSRDSKGCSEICEGAISLPGTTTTDPVVTTASVEGDEFVTTEDILRYESRRRRLWLLERLVEMELEIEMMVASESRRKRWVLSSDTSCEKFVIWKRAVGGWSPKY